MNLIIYVDNLDIKNFYIKQIKNQHYLKTIKLIKKLLLSILNEYLENENDDSVLKNEFFTFKDDINDIDINRKDKNVYIKKNKIISTTNLNLFN